MIENTTEKNKKDCAVNLCERKINDPNIIAVKNKYILPVVSNKNIEKNTSVKRVYPSDLGVALEFSIIIIGVKI